MNFSLKNKKRHLLRIIVPAYPAFNIYSFLADRTTALGPVAVASSARQVDGWDVEVIDENNLRWSGPPGETRGADHVFIQNLREADVVGFYGGLTSTVPRIYQLAQFYKNKGALTLAGGQHFTEEIIPEALCSGIDVVAVGEADETIRDLLSALLRNDPLEPTAGLAFLKNGKPYYTENRPPIEDLDKLPLPDFSLLRYAKIDVFPVGWVRGCGMRCEFCTVKDRPRRSSVERIFEHITRTVETMGARDFFIVDDLFGQYRSETLELCRMLKQYQDRIEKKLDFSVQIRLDRAKDTELLGAMREAGVNTVAIGFESPINEELRAMDKVLKAENMLEYARIFRKSGFYVHGMFIFGYPAQYNSAFVMPAKERIRRFKDFIRKARLDTIQVLLPVPLPGTELRTRLLAQNKIFPLEHIGWEYYDGNFPLFEPDPPLTPEDMQLAIRKIMGWFYNVRYLMMFLMNIFSFPHIIFYFHKIKSGWKAWYRRWRNSLYRIIGYKIIKQWTYHLETGNFHNKILAAKERARRNQSQ